MREVSGGRGGPGGGGGYNFQARATAYVYAHILVGQQMNFAVGQYPVPFKVSAETGGPGDDLQVGCENGVMIEIQAKRGLQARSHPKKKSLWNVVVPFIRGLIAEPSLYGVLLVDTTASTTVRQDLREGIKRLADGRFDGLNDVTEKLRTRLEEAGIKDFSVLRRFAIEVRDFGDGSDGHEKALWMLKEVAKDPPSAWKTLEADAHSLIARRGKRDAEALAMIVSREGGGLSPRAPRPAVAAQAYRDWMGVRTADFYVPGANLNLPIGDAWAMLEAWDDEAERYDGKRPLEERLISYREWARLGLRDGMRPRDRTFDADRLPSAGSRLVVVAGPGAGKSTLQRRLANGLTNTGANVAHIRLPLVADRMKKGATLGEVILDLAASGSGLDRASLMAVLEHPDYLLADGLDECGASRGTVVEGLTEWAAGRPSTRMVVTTRPVGYDAALLPGWRHLELLPFDEDGARTHAGNLLRRLPGFGDAAMETLDEFIRLVGANETAKRAAGNPLLLGFLVRLFADGIAFGRRRAELYGKILQQIRDRDPRHHSSAVLRPAVADRALDRVGWFLQHEVVASGEQVRENLGQALEGTLDLGSLEAQEKAEECLVFWEERGLLERLTAGSHEALVFAHAGLGEYAAARYAARPNSGQLAQWVKEVTRTPRWREVVLLAAGAGVAREVVETLLDLYDPANSIGEELELAARALAETDKPPEDLARRVGDALRGRLEGDIPIVIFGATRSALGLAREVPDLIADAVRPLAGDTNLATRLAAVRLLLECGPEHVDVAHVERVMEDLLDPGKERHELPERGGPIVWDLENQIFFLGAKRLVQARVDDDLDGVLGRAVAGHHRMSWTSHLSIIGHLEDQGYEEIPKRARQRFSYARLLDADKVREGLRRAGEEDHKRDQTFLRAVLEAACETGVPEPLQGDERDAVAALIHGMELFEFPHDDWVAMVEDEEDPPALRVVLRGGMVGLGLDLGRVASEAASLLNRIEKVDPKREEYRTFWADLPRVPVDPRWERVAESNLPAEDLVRALRYPSDAVAMNAANLIANGGGGEVAKELVADLGPDLPQNTYRALSDLIPHLWGGEEALEVLLTLLAGGVTSENYELLLALAELPEAAENERAATILITSLRSQKPSMADMLAREVLNMEFPLAKKVAPHLREVLEHWTRHGTTCEVHGGTIYDDKCPDCKNFVRSPRAELVRFLSEADLLDLGYLSRSCNDARSDVGWSAAKGVSMRAVREDAVADLIQKVETAELPLRVLEEVLTLSPEHLRPAKEALVSLLSSSSVPIKVKVVGALATPGWVDPAEATSLATTALKDKDAGVRSRAVATLRTLEEESS